VLSAFTDNRDIGKLVARTIADPQTLNQQVFLYSEMTTLTKVYDLLEKISGEDVPRDYVSSLPPDPVLLIIRLLLTSFCQDLRRSTSSKNKRDWRFAYLERRRVSSESGVSILVLVGNPR
jgi:hypothetical protein